MSKPVKVSISIYTVPITKEREHRYGDADYGASRQTFTLDIGKEIKVPNPADYETIGIVVDEIKQ